MRSFFSARNLLLCNEKPPWQVVFRRLGNPGRSPNRGNSLVRDMSPNLSFQCSLTKAATSRTLETSLAHPVCQWPLPMAISRVFPGWTQADSYRIRRSGRTERGVRAYSPSWSELPSRNWSVRRGMRNRGHNSGVTPVNRKAGMRGSTREPPGETPGIFKPHRVSPPLI